MHIETRYLLNVGLTFNIAGRTGTGKISAGAVIHELYGVLDHSPVRFLNSTKVERGGKEPVLVIELSCAPSRRAIDNLSTHLWQDCIACYDLELELGELIGPRAASWGAFDGTQFVLPSGATLRSNETTQRVPEGTYAGQPFTHPQPLPLSADTADFSDLGDSNKLATLGVFHTDAQWFKAKRAEENATALRVNGAYHWLGLNRRAESSRIQSDVAGLLPEGIWPRSSGLYAERMHALDAHVLQQAEKTGYAS